MKIDTIKNNCNNTFGALIYESSNVMSQSLRQAMKVAADELNCTSHWDLVVAPDNYGRLIGKYVNKHNPKIVYSSGLENFIIKNNILSCTSFCVNKAKSGFEEFFISFLDLVFATKEQIELVLKNLKEQELLECDFLILEPYTEKELQRDKEVVKLLDSAQTIILDDRVQLRQGTKLKFTA